jgi:hypothetical protein
MTTAAAAANALRLIRMESASRVDDVFYNFYVV